MAMLKKTLVAAVACGAIAFAASAFAQTGAAGPAGAAGGSGAAAGAAMAGTAPGSAGGELSATNAGTNSTANNSLGRTNSNIGTANNVASNTANNGTDNATGHMAGNQLSQNNPANNPGSSRAGTTPAANSGAPVAGAGALPAGETALGGNGITRHRVAVVHHITTHRARRLAGNVTVHHVRRFRVTTHHVIGLSAPIPGEAGVGSAAAIEGLNLGNTATPVAGLSSRQMARVDTHERHITAELNRASLQGSIG